MLIFSQIFRSRRIKCGLLPQPVGKLKLMPNLIFMISIQGRELCLCDSMKCTFSIGLCLDSYRVICFRLGLMQDNLSLKCNSGLKHLGVYSRSQSYRKELLQ